MAICVIKRYFDVAAFTKYLMFFDTGACDVTRPLVHTGARLMAKIDDVYVDVRGGVCVCVRGGGGGC